MLKFFGSYSVKKNGKRNIATKQKNGKSNMQKTQNPFSVPKLSACLFFLFSFLTLECAEIR